MPPHLAEEAKMDMQDIAVRPVGKHVLSVRLHSGKYPTLQAGRTSRETSLQRGHRNVPTGKGSLEGVRETVDRVALWHRGKSRRRARSNSNPTKNSAKS